MMTIRRSEDRGAANHGWLNARHTFSFAEYYDPAWMGYRSLRVINDDRVAPGLGFPMHGHRDMEIVTYILSGKLEHRDSMGNGRVIEAGDIQYMSAGSGVRHSEFNPSTTDPVHLLQIWIQPDRAGYEPRYADRSLREQGGDGKLLLIASPDGRDDSMSIRQDVDLWLGKLTSGEKAAHQPAKHRHLWVHVAVGAVTINGQELHEGDSAGLHDENRVEIVANAKSEVLLFDLA